MSIFASEEEINRFTEQAFENSRDYKQSKFVFCKITYPTLPAAIDYTRKVLCTAIARVGGFDGNGDPRTEKLYGFLKAKGSLSPQPALSTIFDPQFLAAVCERTPVRLGYSVRLYDVAKVDKDETLRDIKEMYLKEDEIAIRAKIGSYDIVDALSSADAVSEYKQLYDRVANKSVQKLVNSQEESGYYRELDCWLNEKPVTVQEFNRLLKEVDPTTGHNIYDSESFNFTDKVTKLPYDGEFTIETVFEHGKESEAVYNFRSFNPHLDIKK